MKSRKQFGDELTLENYAGEAHEMAHALLGSLSTRLNAANIQLMLSLPHAATDWERDQYRVISASILSALTTLSSILTLTVELNLRVKEAVALARVYYETCLMAVFVSLDDGSRARRAELYSIYKTFRTQTRVHSAASYTFKIDRSPRLNRSDPLVQEALKEFGGSSSIRPCFTETREEMVSLIASEHPSAGLLLGGVEGMVHDVSSEIIHGSYHGYRLFSGLYNDQQDQAKNLEAHFETVLFTVCLTTAALARSMRSKSSDTKAMESVSDLALQLLFPYVPDEMKALLEEILFDPNEFR